MLSQITISLRFFVVFFFSMFSFWNMACTQNLKIGVAGLTHTHVHWIFNSVNHHDFEIVGIAEPNRELAKRYARQYDFPMDKIYDTLEDLIQAQSPEAVTAFGSIYGHLEIVKTCAPLGIHVMVEKPLAVSLDHARQMIDLAEKYQIQLLTNYETTWYPSNHTAYDLAKNKTIVGDLRKIIVRDGHQGPKKIGVDDEFFEWLTDPELNGGGAIIDFGCYGANLLTWLMEGKRPKRVTAITQQLQAPNNPKVDDEAIIILDYGSANAIIQASWNWPIGRKDMEIHGLLGTIFSDNRHDLRIRIATGYDTYEEEVMRLKEHSAPFNDPFAYFASVIKGEVQMKPYDLSSLENNLIVMEILDAAIRSAKSGKTIIIGQ